MKIFKKMKYITIKRTSYFMYAARPFRYDKSKNVFSILVFDYVLDFAIIHIAL